VTHLLFERGVGELKLPAHYTGKRLVDLLVLLAARERALPAEIARTAAELEALAAVARPELAAAQRAAGWALERRRAMARCGGTRFAFVVSGYTPAERVPALRAEAAATLGDGIAVFARPVDRAEWGDVPVVLRNRPPIRPFERLLALVPLPRYGSVDPTPWLAVFFPLFFGLVLGDVAFGVIGIAACLLVRWRRWGGTLGRDIAAVGLWCSVSAAVFGLLFGEALGELGVHVGLAPVLLDRRRAFTTFLGIALAVGGAHLAIGMILGIASAARAGHRREAVARAAKLVLLASSAAAICSLLGVLSRAALSPALVGAAVSGGVALLAEGPLAALDVVLALGNVLSYARLMALGLASVMLAEVANLVSEKLKPAAAGVALGVLLHAVNFTLGLISPAIAALRLHYVEFFEKFYDEGGFPFRPFGHAG
jgi:V/A-type H+-transporting ATPase subunit I